MKITHNGKNYRVEEKEWGAYIKTAMVDLEYDTQEDWNTEEIESRAKQIWLEDNEIEINEEQAKLVEETKDIKLPNAKAETKKKRKAPERKPDWDKRFIIHMLEDFVGTFGTDVVIENEQKYLNFNYNGKPYQIDLKFSRNKTK